MMGAAFAALLSAAGCKKENTVAETTINGTLMAGAIKGATVQVLDAQGNQVASGTSIDDGTFSLPVPSDQLGGILRFKSTGGNYQDESTGTTVSLSDTEGLQVMLPANQLSATNTDVGLTPDSTLVAVAAHDWSAHNPGTTNLADQLTAASAAFTASFGTTVDPSVRPVEATSTLSAATTGAQKQAAVRAMAFSDLTSTLGNTPGGQMALVTALGADLADGSLDGKAGGNTLSVGGKMLPSDLLSQFEGAYMRSFSSDRNKTGLKATELGNLPFAKTVKTASYQVKYVPGTMAAMAGKTMFTLEIRDLNGSPAVGVTPTITSMMHMDAMTHSTPSAGCVAASNYQYTCTLYYLMPTAMKGVFMGYWDLAVSLPKGSGTETAMFYPNVKPSMADTPKVDLKGQTEKIMAAGGGSEARRYHIFKKSLTGSTGSHSLSLFVATRASMKSFPAVVTGTTYNTGSTYAFTSTTVVVEVSTDKTTWATMTEQGAGVWSVTGLTGLTNGTAGKVYVRLTINGEQKTLDGKTVGSTNGYGSFSFTPKAM